MCAFQILNADKAHQYTLWLQVWALQFEQNVFHHPQFVKLFCRPGDSALCAYMELPGRVCMFPFILRPLRTEKWAGDQCRYYDITSPYGYGGLACVDKFGSSCMDGNSAQLFWNEFDAWAENHEVVSSFVRFSYQSGQENGFSGKVEQIGNHVIRSLNAELLDLWKDFEHKVRTNIRRAMRNGLRVEIDTGGSRIEEFKKIYYETMDRRQAQPQYYFSDEFFSSIIHNLSGRYAFFHTLQESKVVSTELVLVSQDRLYSFLGGTDAKAFKLYPNEIIKGSVMLWGIKNGKKIYELGGGYSGEDAIFRYKKAFAPRGIMPFQVGKKIYDETAYQRLCEMRKKYELEMGNRISFTDGFFPAYRQRALLLKDERSDRSDAFL